MSPPVTVLYLGGAGRSGSTLLERILDQIPGTVAAGEVVHLGARGLANDESCACGEPFSKCEFWQAVGDEAFGGWASIDPTDWQRCQGRVDRNRHLLKLVAPVIPGFRRDLAVHADRLAALYRAIASVSGADVVIDSSKHVSTALVLRHVPGIDLRIVHLVRDSRGVAYSWTKEVARPEVANGKLMPRFRPSVSAAWWNFFNVSFHGIRALGTPTAFLRYEEMLDDPRRSLQRITTGTGLPQDDEAYAFLAGSTVTLAPSHSVAGNPMRFTSGPIELRRDDAWRDQLATRARIIVTLLTAPLLAAYGYLRKPR